MTFNKKILLIIICSYLFLIKADQIQARENTADEPIVYQQDSLNQDIRQLKIQYRGELEEYRAAERAYLIAKDQYLKLNTLAALEDAVQKTQATMLLRDKVLRTYLRLLRLTLLSQPGVEIEAKKNAEQSLLVVLDKLETHQQMFDQVLDKPQLETIAIDYEILFAEIEDAAYQSLTLISIGELQTIHDKAISLKNDMEVEIATAGGVLKSTERKRSFDEIDRVLSKLKPEFDQMEATYQEKTSLGYDSIYNNIQRKLGSVHSSLSQILTYLGELLKI